MNLRGQRSKSVSQAAMSRLMQKGRDKQARTNMLKDQAAEKKTFRENAIEAIIEVIITEKDSFHDKLEKAGKRYSGPGISPDVQKLIRQKGRKDAFKEGTAVGRLISRLKKKKKK